MLAAGAPPARSTPAGEPRAVPGAGERRVAAARAFPGALRGGPARPARRPAAQFARAGGPQAADRAGKQSGPPAPGCSWLPAEAAGATVGRLCPGRAPAGPGHQGPQIPVKNEPQDGENSNPPNWSRTVVRDVRLISAKTGYGVEELISALQRSWRYRGDVYLVGATNAGKSTLFNTLLESDYCTAKGSEAIDRATISPWPGTTLNLLKFPICNPTPYRMFKRHQRLKKDSTQAEEDLSEQEQNQLNVLKKHGYVVGRVGRTFLYSEERKDTVPFEFDADSLAFDMENEPVMGTHKSTKQVELTAQDVKDAHWFYDTPGITKENCILNLLTEKEVNIVLPTQSIVPRTFVLKPGMVLFLGAIGRIDFLQGNQSAWFTVVASNTLPVHISSLDRADTLYQKHAGHTLLQVPMGGKERMAGFPPLVAEDIMLKEGRGHLKQWQTSSFPLQVGFQ